ncbi:MAG TPA: nitroreductase [Marinobacter sp.]|nr:nitroreductase [Marinobacter sp.]
MVSLPSPETCKSRPLVDCLANRRSIREYTDGFLTPEELSQLLWSAQGITGPNAERATPSAGGSYPLRIRILVRRVVSFEPGIYEYQSAHHSLKLLGKPASGQLCQRMGIGDQPWLSEAAAVFGIAAESEDSISQFRSQPPPGQRGWRYLYMESGALAQNVHLQCTALGLGCVLVGGFDDTRVKEVFRLPIGTEPTALICIGQQR